MSVLRNTFKNEIKIFNSGLHRARALRMDARQKQRQATLPSPSLPLARPPLPSFSLPLLPLGYCTLGGTSVLLNCPPTAMPITKGTETSRLAQLRPRGIGCVSFLSTGGCGRTGRVCEDGMKTLVAGQQWGLEGSEFGFHAVSPPRILLGSDSE